VSQEHLLPHPEASAEEVLSRKLLVRFLGKQGCEFTNCMYVIKAAPLKLLLELLKTICCF